MAHIKIDDQYFDVPEAVVQRMQEYHYGMKKAEKELDKIKLLFSRLRKMQVKYFTDRAPDVLRACKALEREADDYLSGTSEKQSPQQQELFR